MVDATSLSQDLFQRLQAVHSLVALLELELLVGCVASLGRLSLDTLKFGQNFCDVQIFLRILLFAIFNTFAIIYVLAIDWSCGRRDMDCIGLL